jgi:hypothetical protein
MDEGGKSRAVGGVDGVPAKALEASVIELEDRE